jgi:hypothetical protein
VRSFLHSVLSSPLYFKNTFIAFRIIALSQTLPSCL